VVATAAYLKTPIAQTANPTLSVDVKADRHPISPDIYGMNHYALEPALAKELRIPVERWGLITPAATTGLWILPTAAMTSFSWLMAKVCVGLVSTA